MDCVPCQVGIDPEATCAPPTDEKCIEWPPTSQEPLLDKLVKDYEEQFGTLEDALGKDVIINDAPRRGPGWDKHDSLSEG